MGSISGVAQIGSFGTLGACAGSTVRRSAPENEEQLEKLRAFDEVVEELVPSYGETAALSGQPTYLATTAPNPSCALRARRKRAPSYRTVLSAVRRGWFWACTVDGVCVPARRCVAWGISGAPATTSSSAPGLLVAATERGFYRLIRR